MNNKKLESFRETEPIDIDLFEEGIVIEQALSFIRKILKKIKIWWIREKERSEVLELLDDIG